PAGLRPRLPGRNCPRHPRGVHGIPPGPRSGRYCTSRCRHPRHDCPPDHLRESGRQHPLDPRYAHRIEQGECGGLQGAPRRHRAALEDSGPAYQEHGSNERAHDQAHNLTRV
ncbi:hypothetical protein H4R19_002290, partial [Coemansia spiralis]